MKKEFFDIVRSELFKGKLSQAVVDKLTLIYTVYKNSVTSINNRELAYIFATTYHESYSAAKNPDWLPVREGFTKTNQGAINAVTNLFNRKVISKNYALPNSKGLSYYGRGDVQITWESNYLRIGKLLNIDLINKPDLALNPSISVRILVEGMLKGWFTGKKLSTYIKSTPTHNDYVNARRIINGSDSAAKIAKEAEIFYKALTR